MADSWGILRLRYLWGSREEVVSDQPRR